MKNTIVPNWDSANGEKDKSILCAKIKKDIKFSISQFTLTPGSLFIVNYDPDLGDFEMEMLCSDLVEIETQHKVKILLLPIGSTFREMLVEDRRMLLEELQEGSPNADNAGSVCDV